MLLKLIVNIILIVPNIVLLIPRLILKMVIAPNMKIWTSW